MPNVGKSLGSLTCAGFAGILTLVAALGYASIGPRQLPRSELFTFHSDGFVNLHHFLYRWAQAGPGADTSSLDRRIRLRDADAGVLANMPDEDRESWEAAVAYYRRSMIDRDLLFDSELVALRDCLVMAGNYCDRVAERDQTALDLLNDTMGLYRRYWWARHNAANRRWMDEQIPNARRFEGLIAPRIATAYGGTWPETRSRVDLTIYADRVGGYTTSDGHITVSSIEAGTQGWLGLELLFHEASHGDSMELALRRLIREAFGAAGAASDDVPPDLWHMTIFFTAGHVTRSVLAEAGIEYPQTYAELAEIFERREANIRASAVLSVHWTPALDAQSGYATAMRRAAEMWLEMDR